MPILLMFSLVIPIRLIKWSILRMKKRVDSKEKICYLVVLNENFLTQIATRLVPQND